MGTDIPDIGKRLQSALDYFSRRQTKLFADEREETRPYFAYATNYLIDTKSSVIMDVEATRARRLKAARRAIARTKRLHPSMRAAQNAFSGRLFQQNPTDAGICNVQHTGSLICHNGRSFRRHALSF